MDDCELKIGLYRLQERMLEYKLQVMFSSFFRTREVEWMIERSIVFIYNSNKRSSIGRCSSIAIETTCSHFHDVTLKILGFGVDGFKVNAFSVKCYFYIHKNEPLIKEIQKYDYRQWIIACRAWFALNW